MNIYINENERVIYVVQFRTFELIQCLTAVKENVVADRAVTAPLAPVNVMANVRDPNNQTHLYGCGSRNQRVNYQAMKFSSD
ncbi:unnamed protein product [Schistosoma rodhaini]|uniref:Uncharacterized protein n=1 Tax=Schistosoma rodhaini TaxID=6188 RepID=A0AA85F161_9TREM|nr:unnamed protein product [Schistosoma rodhaini]